MIHYKAYDLEDDILLIEVGGALDSYTARDFFDCLESEIEKGHQKIIVACANLTELSSSGLAALVRAHARMKKVNGDVRLAGLKGAAMGVLRITHLDRVFGIYPDVERARQAYQSTHMLASG